MRFQDQFPVVIEIDDFVKEEEEYDFFKEENGESQDMWSLMRSEPRSDAFASLLAGDGGKECKFDAKTAVPWDLVPPKPYVPLARSRSSLSNESLQLCTEGLGCESCDCLLDSTSSSSLSEIADDYFAGDAEIDEVEDHGKTEEQEKKENEENEENEDEDEDEEEFEEKNHSARSFPPPLLTLGGSSAAHLRSFKKDGRFVLQSVKAPLLNFLHTHRGGGRLQMHLVSTTEDDEVAALPLAPKLQDEVPAEEVEEGFGEEEAPEICSIPALSDTPALHQSTPFPEDSFDNHCDSSMKCNKSPPPVEFKLACSKPPEKCKAVDNESSNGKREIQEGKSSPKQSASCNQNTYSGWRTEIGEQTSAVFCQNLQKAQALPNYPVNKLKYGEAVSMINVHVNVSDHARLSKFWVKDLGMARCHDANSLSVWGKYPCIATSS